MTCPDFNNDFATKAYVDSKFNQLQSRIKQLESKIGTKIDSNQANSLIRQLTPIIFLGLIGPTTSKIANLQSQIGGLFGKVAQALGMSAAALAQVAALAAQLGSIIAQIYHYIALNNQDGQIWAAISRLELSINSTYTKAINAIISVRNELNPKIERANRKADQADRNADNAYEKAVQANLKAEAANRDIKITNQKITNLTTQFNQLKSNLTTQFNQLKSEINRKIQNIYSQIQGLSTKISSGDARVKTDLQKLIESDVSNLESQFNQKLQQIKSQIQSEIERALRQLRIDFQSKIDQLKGLIEDLENELQKLRRELIGIIDNVKVQLDILRVKIYELLSYLSQVRETLSKYGIDINKLVREDSRLWADIQGITSGLATLTNSLNNLKNLTFDKIGQLQNSFTNRFNNLKNNLDNQLRNMNIDFTPINNKITNLDRKIDLNSGQLNGIALGLVTLTALTRNVGNSVNNLTPTPCRFAPDTISPQIKADTEIIKAQNLATQGGVASNIGLTTAVQNTTNTISTTATNINTAIVGTAGTMINAGGLTGGIIRLYQVLKIDRWLNLLGTAANLHNAYMLSADLGETMLFMVDALLNATGMEFKDAEGNSTTFSDVISGTVSSFIKGIIGAENYAEINLQISQFNRIYQAAMNAVYALGDIIDGVRQVSEITGENTSKIGNALRNSGVVAENAYSFMFEDLSNLSREDDRINKFGQNIQNTEDKLQAIITVAQAISSIADAVVQIQASRQEFELALKDYEDPYGKAQQNTKGGADYVDSKDASTTPTSLTNATIGSRFSDTN